MCMCVSVCVHACECLCAFVCVCVCMCVCKSSVTNCLLSKKWLHMILCSPPPPPPPQVSFSSDRSHVYKHVLPVFICVRRAEEMNVVMTKAMMMNLARVQSSLINPPFRGIETTCIGFSRLPMWPEGEEMYNTQRE